MLQVHIIIVYMKGRNKNRPLVHHHRITVGPLVAAAAAAAAAARLLLLSNGLR